MPYQSHSRRDRDDHRIPLSREEELRIIRKEWQKTQELKEKHERHKRERIEKFELERARKLALQKSKTNRSHSPGSSSRSRSKDDKSRSGNHSNACKTSIMSEKCDIGSSSTKLFKGPEGTKISIDELKKIKIEIGKQKKIGSTNRTADIERDIINPEDVIVRRRDGEGANPIFEREELNSKDTESEERRVILEANGKKDRRRRSISLSPPRRSRSPSRRTSRYDSSSNYYPETSNRHRSHSRERRDRHRDYRSSRSLERSHRHESHRSSSRERINSYRNDSHSRDTHYMYPDSRDYARNDLRERRLPPPYYNIEPMPVSFYYPNFARPIMINPMMTMRGPLPIGRGRMPPIMTPIRPPFMPRGFIPPEIFRQNIPPTQREGATPLFSREEFNPISSEDRRVISLDDQPNAHSRRSRRLNSSSPPTYRHSSRSPRRELRHESSSRQHGNQNERNGSPRHRSSRHSSYHRSPVRDERDSRYHSSRNLTHRDYYHARDNSRDQRDGDDRIRDRGIPYPHPYIAEPIPLSMYYGNFVRPMIMDPLMAMRAPMPPMMRGRVPQMMGHMRHPFGARFQLPPQIFRPNMPPNQRFGRMY